MNSQLAEISKEFPQEQRALLNELREDIINVVYKETIRMLTDIVSESLLLSQISGECGSDIEAKVLDKTKKTIGIDDQEINQIIEQIIKDKSEEIRGISRFISGSNLVERFQNASEVIVIPDSLRQLQEKIQLETQRGKSTKEAISAIYSQRMSFGELTAIVKLVTKTEQLERMLKEQGESPDSNQIFIKLIKNLGSRISSDTQRTSSSNEVSETQQTERPPETINFWGHNRHIAIQAMQSRIADIVHRKISRMGTEWKENSRAFDKRIRMPVIEQTTDTLIRIGLVSQENRAHYINLFNNQIGEITLKNGGPRTQQNGYKRKL